MKRILVLSLLVLAALASGAHAQVSMKVNVGFDQHYKTGCWVPITVEMENLGAAADGNLVTEDSRLQGMGASMTRYQTPFKLPSGARKRYFLYARLQGSSTRVNVSAEMWKNSLDQEIRVEFAQPEDRVLLSISSAPGALNFLAGTKLPQKPGQGQLPGMTPPPGMQNQGEIKVWNADPALLPDHWKGYDSVDVMAIGSIAASALSGDQQKAIDAWVRAGGTLVISGGVDWRRLTDPFYKNLLPVEVTGSTQLSSMGGLAAFCHAGAPMTGAFLVPASKPVAGSQAQVIQDGTPILAERTLGLGKVVYLATDFAQPPMNGWNGQAAIWKKYLVNPISQDSFLADLKDDLMGNAYPQNYRYNAPTNQLASAVVDIPSMDVPSFSFIGLFLACYIIVLVPVNYFVLKKKDKREYAWVTIPIIVVFFSLAAYGIGYAIKGGQVLLNQAGVIEANAGESQGAALSCIGLFSPGKTRYELSFKDRRTAAGEAVDPNNQQTGNLTVEIGDGTNIRDFDVDMWSMRLLQAESVVDLGGSLNIAGTPKGKGFAGKIDNNTKYTLEDCGIFYRGNVVGIGKLPGGAQGVNFDTSSGKSPAKHVPLFKAGSTSKKIQNAIWNQVHNSGNLAQSPRPILCGWVRQPVVSPDINRGFVKREAVTLVVVHL